jgi:hypothetical protein
MQRRFAKSAPDAFALPQGRRKMATPQEEEIVCLGNSLTALRSLAEGATPINRPSKLCPSKRGRMERANTSFIAESRWNFIERN